MTQPRHLRILATVAGVVALFLLAIGVAASALIWEERQSALSDSSLQAKRFASGAVAALNRSLVSVDVLLTSLAETQDMGSLQLFEIDRVAASQTLRAIVRRNLMLRRLALVDAQGQALAISDATVSDVSEGFGLPPDFLAHALSAHMSDMAISAPQVVRGGTENAVFLARPIRLADGSRILAVAEVLLMHLNTILLQGADIGGLEVTLERRDGTLITSDPVQTKLLGRVLGQPLDETFHAQVQELPSRLSGIAALVVVQPVMYDDLRVVASIPMQSALGRWKTERDFIVTVAVLFALMVVAAGVLAGRYWSRMAQARQDIRQSKAEAEQLAFYDYLTGLPNRMLLMDRLQHAVLNCERSGRQGALLFLDLDNFKTINDTLGHSAGDVLLKQVAERLRKSVRQVDTVARFGGDEFVIVFENLSPNDLEAAELVKRISDMMLAALNLPFEAAGQTFKTGASLGAVLFGTDLSVKADDLLKQADIAMYQSKSSGRNKLCFFDPAMQATISAHNQMEADLRRAIEQQQFLLYYQPQVTEGGSVIGAEVLIRWQHPERGMVPPFEFIPVAEESDLINQIGLWVMHEACLQLKRWQRDPKTTHLQLAVNVSARQFRQRDFVDVVQQVLRETEVAPAGLKLELTESLVLVDVQDTISKMNAVRALGVRFSIDDFGTGQSSLSYLTQLPLDQLKIDQSFVRNIGVKPTDNMIVQTIIGMASHLSLEVIAEGVETSGQRDFLAANGCHLYQGYLFARPGPLADFEHLLMPAASLAPQPTSAP